MNEEELSGLKLERQQLSEQLTISQEALDQTTTQLEKQCGHLEDRVGELSQQNAVLHEEAEKVCLHAVHPMYFHGFIHPHIHTLCMYMYIAVSSAADTSAPDWRGRGHDAH